MRQGQEILLAAPIREAYPHKTVLTKTTCSRMVRLDISSEKRIGPGRMAGPGPTSELLDGCWSVAAKHRSLIGNTSAAPPAKMERVAIGYRRCLKNQRKATVDEDASWREFGDP